MVCAEMDLVRDSNDSFHFNHPSELWSLAFFDSHSIHEFATACSHDSLSRIYYSAGELTEMTDYVLKLYITGESNLSERAIRNITHICDGPLAGQCTLEIIDLQQCPEVAETRRILATPTLVRESPKPIRMVVGDLSDPQKVLLGLDLVQETELPSNFNANGDSTE